MKFKLQSKQGNELPGHTLETKNYRLTLVEVAEPAAPGDPLSMIQGPGGLQFSVTRTRADYFNFNDEYEFDIS